MTLAFASASPPIQATSLTGAEHLGWPRAGSSGGDAALLIAPLDGHIDVQNGASSLRAGPRQILCLPSGGMARPPAHPRLSGSGALRVIRFLPEKFDLSPPEVRARWASAFTQRREGLTGELFEALYLARSAGGMVSTGDLRLFQVLLDHLRPDSQTDPIALPLGQDPRLRRITEPLSREPASERQLEDWAQLAGASPRTIARLFVQETGRSFKIWRQHARIRQAVELLKDGRSMTDVAFSVGYETPNAFTASFKAMFGCSPRSYLKQAAPGA